MPDEVEKIVIIEQQMTSTSLIIDGFIKPLRA